MWLLLILRSKQLGTYRYLVQSPFPNTKGKGAQLKTTVQTTLGSEKWYSICGGYGKEDGWNSAACWVSLPLTSCGANATCRITTSPTCVGLSLPRPSKYPKQVITTLKLLLYLDGRSSIPSHFCAMWFWPISNSLNFDPIFSQVWGHDLKDSLRHMESSGVSIVVEDYKQNLGVFLSLQNRSKHLNDSYCGVDGRNPAQVAIAIGIYLKHCKSWD